MAEQEFLASFGVEIDESGVARLQVALEQNRELAEELAAAFDHAREAVQSFFRDLSEVSMPNMDSAARVTEQQEGISIPFSLDFTKATQELNAFFKAASKSFRLNADGSGIVSAGQNALSQLQRMFSDAVLPLQVSISTSSGADGNKSGLSGALSSLTSLLTSSTVSSVTTNNASKTVSAPVSIQVTAAGSDPTAVGQSVYDITEQYLLRTLTDSVG